jgi:hypothetical protein
VSPHIHQRSSLLWALWRLLLTLSKWGFLIKLYALVMVFSSRFCDSDKLVLSSIVNWEIHGRLWRTIARFTRTSFDIITSVYTVTRLMCIDCLFFPSLHSCVLFDANPRESTNAQILMCDHHAKFIFLSLSIVRYRLHRTWSSLFYVGNLNSIKSLRFIASFCPEAFIDVF